MNRRKRGAPKEMMRRMAVEGKMKKKNSEYDGTARLTSSSASQPSSSRKTVIDLPVDVILRMANKRTFEDFQNVVMKRWPDARVPHIIRQKMWQMSPDTRELETIFLNMEKLTVSYNYIPTRKVGKELFVNMESLSSIFGGVKIPEVNQFINLSELKPVVKMDVNVNACDNYRHASCLCHLSKSDSQGLEEWMSRPREDSCKYGHSHHFCSEHVIAWLDDSVYNKISRLHYAQNY